MGLITRVKDDGGNVLLIHVSNLSSAAASPRQASSASSKLRTNASHTPPGVKAAVLNSTLIFSGSPIRQTAQSIAYDSCEPSVKNSGNLLRAAEDIASIKGESRNTTRANAQAVLQRP
jgi:hypothetical protein